MYNAAPKDIIVKEILFLQCVLLISGSVCTLFNSVYAHVFFIPSCPRIYIGTVHNCNIRRKFRYKKHEQAMKYCKNNNNNGLYIYSVNKKLLDCTGLQKTCFVCLKNSI